MPVDQSLLVAMSDAELSDALGGEVATREEVHRWPLSLVERVHLTDGTDLAYKAQLQPNVEAEFYAAARSPVVLPASVLAEGPCTHLVLPWAAEPSLSKQHLAAADLVEVIAPLAEKIAAIEGDLPTYLDLASESGIRAVIDPTMTKAAVLAGDGRLPTITPDDLAFVSDWASRPAMLHALTSDRRFTNGDLTADQIFPVGNGSGQYRVVDWQRPLWATAGMDLVSVLLDGGHDPGAYADWPPIAAFWVQRLHWAVVAQYDFFPDQGWPVFDHWAREAIANLRAIA